MPTRQEIIDYITQSATRRGIDPNTVLRVFTQESRLNPSARNVTPREESYGIAQLNVKGGLGVEARRRGIEASDPNQWKQHVDFSLDTVKRDGWRQWMGARDVGIPRWEGVNRGGTIKLDSEPTLQQLSPPSQPKPISSTTSTQILRQMAPTEGSNMARPSVRDAIRQSMDELGIRDQLQYAGFVPPGITKGAAATRGAANKAVRPKGTIKDVEGEAKRREELRNVPDTERQMSGSYADYVKAEKARMEGRTGQGGKGDTDLPPGVKSATDPSGAVDPRTGTAVEVYDPTLAVQNDPSARSALIASKLVGRVDPNSGGRVPRTSSTTPAGRAATAAGATALGVAGATGDKDVDAVQKKIQGGAQAAPGQDGQGGANVDPGTLRMLQQAEQSAGLPPGTLSGRNAGVLTSALPIVQEAFKDPATRAAGAQVAKALISTKARQDAMRADVARDPTFYQRQAAVAQQQPGGGGGGDPIADRAMERAVMMDNAMRGSRQPVPPQQVPQGRTTRGTVSVRQTPPEMRSTEQQIVDQAIPPGAEKGDAPPTQQLPPPASGVYPDYRQFSNYGDQFTVNHGLPRGVVPPPTSTAVGPQPPMTAPQMTPQMMDPTMMQLMQFFTQGGGGTGDGY